MKADIKERWLEALRSGEYVQGTGLLRTEDDTYCCLGVLCDLAVQDGVVEWERSVCLECDGDCDHWHVRAHSGNLPQEVCEWAGLPNGDPAVNVDGTVQYLAELNDNGTTFDRIAELIEQSL